MSASHATQLIAFRMEPNKIENTWELRSMFLHCLPKWTIFCFILESCCLFLCFFPLHFLINQTEQGLKRTHKHTILYDITWNNVKSTNKNKTISKTIIKVTKGAVATPIKLTLYIGCSNVRCVLLHFCHSNYHICFPRLRENIEEAKLKIASNWNSTKTMAFYYSAQYCLHLMPWLGLYISLHCDFLLKIYTLSVPELIISMHIWIP